MPKLLSLLFLSLIAPTICFGQAGQAVTTTDGKKVILRPDKTAPAPEKKKGAIEGDNLIQITDLSSFEETIAWLTKTLNGNRGRGFRFYRYDSILELHSLVVTLNTGRARKVYVGMKEYSYSTRAAASMTNLESVGRPPDSTETESGKQIDGTSLDLTFSGWSNVKLTRSGEFNSVQYANHSYIYLSDKRLAPAVEKAFRRLGTLCAGR